jgi:uncharacterized protein YqfA (UPF0365 family)
MRTVIEMAREAGFTSGELAFMQDNFLLFAELVRADAVATEREACAKVAEDKGAMVQALLNVTSQPIAIAAAIRARSNT